MRAVRGIPNPTGTSCHVGSALVLLKYCLGPLGSLILAKAAENGHNDDVVYWLGRIVQSQSTTTTVDQETETLNMKLVFDTLRKHVGIESRNVGDVITTFLKLIHYLCQLTKDDNQQDECTLSAMWNQLCNTGKVHSILSRHCCCNTESCFIQKETKQRSMTIPFRIDVSTNEPQSLVNAIHNTLQPHLVKDYVWQDSPTCLCEHPTQSAATTRRVCVDSLPSVWMLHLDRYSHSVDNNTANIHRTVSIPSILQVHEIVTTCTDQNKYYELVGGILLSQVVVGSNDDEQLMLADNQGGDHRHYLPLIRHDDGIWYLLDDDDVPQIIASEDRCRELFGGVSQGDESPFRDNNHQTVFVCGHVLVYREATQPMDVVESLVPKDDEDPSLLSSTLVDWTLPTTLIGRRLRIQWAKGTYYSGVVHSYDENTDQHEIVYDDGDIKMYILRKKTIEWLY